jgi:translation initiation factor IF-3
VGILALHEAISMARARDMDLVEVAPNAVPPVCRVVDYGKFRYEQAKRERESKKHQHANRVKEVQLTASIDPHDYEVKLGHAVDFLCEDMKVKISLRFRGREMMHQEFGRQVVARFTKDLGSYGHPDAEPRLVGKGLHVMVMPLPRNRRAKNPRQPDAAAAPAPAEEEESEEDEIPEAPAPPREAPPRPAPVEPPDRRPSASINTPFAQLGAQLGNRPAA